MPAVQAWMVLAAITAQLTGGTESVGVVAVAAPPEPGPELVEITNDLRQRVAEHHAGVLGAHELRERMTGAAPGASLAELDRAYEGARAAYVKGDHESSVRTLRTIVEELEKLPDGADTFASWTRAVLRLARSELNLGHEQAARDSLERLVRAAPDVEVDRALYPASFANAVEKARSALAAAPRRSVAITASREGTRVYVNGRDVGLAPLTVLLPRGRHKLSGTKDRVRAGPVVVDVGDEDEGVFLDFTIPEAVRPAAGPGLALPDGDRARWIVAAGAHMRLEGILAVTLVEEAGATYLVGSLYDVRRGMLKREARVRLSGGRVPVGGSGALAEFLMTGNVTSALVERPDPRAPSLTPSSMAVTSDPIADAVRLDASIPARRPRMLGWVAVGTGVASLGLAVLGAVEARSARESYDRARQLREADPLVTNAAIATYNGYVSEGDAAKRNATLSWIGAGAGAVATGVVGYVNYRRTGEFGPFRF